MKKITIRDWIGLLKKVSDTCKRRNATDRVSTVYTLPRRLEFMGLCTCARLSACSLDLNYLWHNSTFMTNKRTNNDNPSTTVLHSSFLAIYCRAERAFEFLLLIFIYSFIYLFQSDCQAGVSMTFGQISRVFLLKF